MGGKAGRVIQFSKSAGRWVVAGRIEGGIPFLLTSKTKDPFHFSGKIRGTDVFGVKKLVLFWRGGKLGKAGELGEQSVDSGS